MVAEADDALMEKFFDAGTLTQEELLAGLKRGVAAGRVFPVLCASATANIGMQPLLDAIVAYVPSPAERPLQGDDTRRAARTSPSAASDSGPAAAFVWKTVADPFAGRITMFRVVSGSLKADSTVHNVDQGHARAARAPGPAAGQDADDGAGDQGGRHRRRRQAEGNADERRARRQGRARSRSPRSSSRSR